MLWKILKTLSTQACRTISPFIIELICCKHIYIALLATIVFSFSFISLSSDKIYAETVYTKTLNTINTETSICPSVLKSISYSTSGTLSQDSNNHHILHQPLKPVSPLLNDPMDSNPQQDEENPLLTAYR